MISLRQRVLWASLMASAAFAASAQQPAPVGAAPVQAQMAPSGPAPQEAAQAKADKPGHRGEHKKLDPAERFERMHKRMVERQAQLKDKLKLNASQEAAWAQYTGALQPPVPPATGQSRLSRADFAKLSTPERLDRMQARQAERQARFAQRAQATKQFYAQLTPEQQKTFDAETLQRHGPRHGHGPHHPHHRGHDGHAPAAPAKS
ncbi:Spy/CpxP family protein refolding chaperone [Xenophilus sp. Marseille-Q4582]|uniref:Spy/CpxP family protein refolding chaperone n=1 Tax=Xenophilus sp. Marseille-Q4582 TaxID=2866600 RepID=UPI001CE46018|nr:Spy/CpxP family protein refolding chaperone [Xenophilus sp. Marseille-Q4582]